MKPARKLAWVGTGAGLFALAGAAAGQNQWLVDVAYSDPAGVINSLDDTATVTLWAAWDPQYYAFGLGGLDVVADDPIDSGIWSDPESILYGPGAFEGIIDGELVEGAVAAQLHFPGQFFADTSNPIAAWTATWSTVNLHSRDVPVTTDSFAFRVYSDIDGNVKDLFGSLEEGMGVIHVIPAPSASPLLLAVVIAVGRPRRRA